MLALLTLTLVACDRPNDTRVASVTPAPNTAEPPPLPVKSDGDTAEVEAVMKTIALSPPFRPLKDGTAENGIGRRSEEARARRRYRRGRDERCPLQRSGRGPHEKQEVANMPKRGQANDHSGGPPNERNGLPRARSRTLHLAACEARRASVRTSMKRTKQRGPRSEVSKPRPPNRFARNRTF